jgi:hypothetical protein
MTEFQLGGYLVSNLLLITDMARLRKIFGRLTDDRNIRLRIVNNLEKGGEEIAIEKPDVVFVQTHLSGLSADILLMHLKKQLGRKRSRFVVLASPGQISDAVLKPFQGWLDTSLDDSALLEQLKQLLVTLLAKPKKAEEPVAADAAVDLRPLPVSSAESSALLGTPPAVVAPPAAPELLPVSAPPAAEPTLEEQGITYAPRQRLTVYSEFNNSFDNAVSSTPEPETLEEATPTLVHDWRAEKVETADSKPLRSKKSNFLLWLVPVVIIVTVVTYVQTRTPAPKAEPVVAKIEPAPVVKPAAPAPAQPVVAQAPPTAVTVPLTPAAPAPAPAPVAATPAPQAKSAPLPPVAPLQAAVPAAVKAAAKVPAKSPEQISDKAVMSAIAEGKGAKKSAEATPAGPRPTTLPDFIPRYGYDKKYGVENPGWERYKGQVTEFKILREGKAIKAIQVVDRGGRGVPESFMKGVMRQVAKKPSFATDSSEKKDGYDIQRGKVNDNIKAVYYRDEDGGRLRAFVLTWQ